MNSKESINKDDLNKLNMVIKYVIKDIKDMNYDELVMYFRKKRKDILINDKNTYINTFYKDKTN